jgi:methanogenic corrinoid protein MtbC1
VEMPVAELTSMVESEIIPRLYQAHPPLAVTALEADNPMGLPSAESFVRLVLSRSSDALTSFIDAKRQDNVSDDTIYADLLAPSARLLVDLWRQDEVSYTEVTIGLGRLQQLVRGLDTSTPYNGENDPMSRSSLFAPCPGEQQTFGFFLIEELFRWSGWRTWIETSATKDELAANVRCRWFDMLCLGVSRSDNFEDVAATIRSVRRASRNRDLFVLVNGRPFVERPETVASVGADACASSGPEALYVADEALRSVAAE